MQCTTFGQAIGAEYPEPILTPALVVRLSNNLSIWYHECLVKPMESAFHTFDCLNVFVISRIPNITLCSDGARNSATDSQFCLSRGASRFEIE